MEIKKLKVGESILHQSNEKLSVCYLLKGWEVAMIARKNPTREKGNEDCMALIELGDKGFVMVVADGAGGYAQADLASRAACEAICSYLKDQLDNHIEESSAGLREWVPGAIDHASRKVKELAPMGRTTLTVGAISGDQIRSYQVGDSELVVMGQRGKVKHRTQSHSPVGYAVAVGDLDEKEALHHPDRHLVSNFLGDEDFRVEVSSPTELSDKDSVLLGSDGLFDNFLAKELIERVRVGSLQERAADLANRIDHNFSDQGEAALKFDDVSVILAKRI